MKDLKDMFCPECGHKAKQIAEGEINYKIHCFDCGADFEITNEKKHKQRLKEDMPWLFESRNSAYNRLFK